tara:strand:- start:650 stop:1027 length:378 start_codon:yes stop_codon:yes gene_type:complete
MSNDKNVLYIGIAIVLGAIVLVNGGLDISVNDNDKGNLITGMAVEEPFCSSPYIEYQQGSCCLDADLNGICDDDESVIVEDVVEETVVEEVVEESMETCPYECEGDLVCRPIYSNNKIVRWACSL